MDDPTPTQDVGVRAPGYIAARTGAQCPHCGRGTRVLALAVPPGHEVFDSEATEEEAAWQPVAATAFLFHVSQLSEPVRRRVAALCLSYREVVNETTSNVHWVNHCEHCGLPLDDHELHCEPGVFMPWSDEQASGIELLGIDEPFEAAAAGYSLEPEYLRSMRRV